MQQGILRWTPKNFSEGGKKVLIKAALQAIPSYAMSCFRLPATICADMELLMTRFWWGSMEENRRMHWAAWDHLSRPKHEGGLGFRRLVLFNKALLAKQVWRMIQSLESLVASIFWARYFRNVDIMDAPLGANPSNIWRSLCWSRDILEHSLIWRVGDGNSIWAYKDMWVPSLASGRIQSRRALCTNSNVARYITPERSWNTDLLNQAFLPHEVAAILRIPLPATPQHDMRYWRHETKGEYTVKTGYQQAYMAVFGQPLSSGPSSASVQAGWWKWMWALNIPPKVRVFLWRLTHSFLSTESELARRHVHNNQSCTLCGFWWGSMSHVLLFCPAVRLLWKQAGFWGLLKGHSSAVMLDIIFFMRDALSERDFGKWVVLLWGAWRTRCTLLHETTPTHTLDLADIHHKFLPYGPEAFLLSYEEAQNTLHASSGPRSTHPQETLASGDLLLEVDAAFRDDTTSYAAGYVIRNEHRKPTAAGCSTISPPGSIVAADLEAIRKGLMKCVQLNMAPVRVFSDSQSAIKAINANATYLGPEAFVLDSVARLNLASLVREFAYRPRHQLTTAHNLAKFTTISPGPHDWSDTEIPSWVV